MLYNSMPVRLWLFVLLAFIESQTFAIPSQILPKCLLIMSYHSGYIWNDGIEAGVEQTLAGKCNLKKFYMDTKRNQDSEFAQKMALKAKGLIESYQPDIVIACDDNASRYLVKPYFKNSKIPFVFCGINWTADLYGYPYKNTTGMIEVAPIIRVLKTIKKTVPNVKKGVYLSADVITEHKDYVHYQQEYTKNNIELKGVFVTTMKQWKEAFIEAQSADFIIINNYAGINDWNEKIAIAFVKQHGKKFSVTNYRWMMSFAMFSLTKDAYEQGRWSAEVSLSILAGTPISKIPITVNKEWEMFVNLDLLKSANISMDENIIRRASHSWR